MKSFFWPLTVILVIVGLFIPLLWVVAVVTAFIAVGAAPAGTRADGKSKTGGLLGGVWDAAVVGSTMKDCKFCKSKIPDDASTCRYCAKDQPALEAVGTSTVTSTPPEPNKIQNRIVGLGLIALLVLIIVSLPSLTSP